MHLVLVNCIGSLSLSRHSDVGLAGRPNMAIAVYRGREASK